MGKRGPNYRDQRWVLNIEQQCCKANVSFFFKQWGGVNKKKTGRLLKSSAYSQMRIS